MGKTSLFLVTGGAGFIGSNLCETLLTSGYRVRCLDNLFAGKLENIDHLMNHEKFEWMEGTITDYQQCLSACHDVDYVLHQAALGSVPRSMKYPLIYEETNVKGMLNMLEASVQCKVKKFVYASSSSVYGDSQELPKIEGNEGNVLSPYALTKKMNEQYAKLYNDLYGLETVGLRYFNVFGMRQDPSGEYAAVIPKFIEKILHFEQPLINGDGTQSRDFTYVKNVVSANIRAAFSTPKTNGKAYNIGCGSRITLNELARELCKALGREEIRPVYGPDRAGDIKHSHAEIKKATNDFNYQPDYSFSEGIEETIAWYSNNRSTLD